jgi:NADH-quinone oxidoreductase subunit M
MPGSSNFIGEFMILLGAFDSHIAVALIAAVAVVGASFYALRLFIRAMHNRVGGRVRSLEISRAEAIAIVPLCLIILALAFYPQFGLSKSESTMKVAMYPAAQVGSPTPPYALPGATVASMRSSHAPLGATAYAAAVKPTETARQ